MNSSPVNPKDISKQLEYVKQQEQLRALGDLKHNPKTLSADRMIEDLLSKKEIFVKCSPETQQKQEVTEWLAGPVPPMYNQVWASVQSANGLADTPTLSGLLMSSGLPTDTLAYIWSLANHTVPGALTQQEVYLVLAIVALTQSGYHVNNPATVLQLPQAPLPALDLALLPPPRQQAYPTPLNVATLPDPHTNNWITHNIQSPTVPDKINVSYVSSGSTVSSKLASDNSLKDANFSFTALNINPGTDIQSDTAASSTSTVTSSKSTHNKHSANAYTFSFPSLNESPSHIASPKSEGSDPFDDEFTDFQSADFTSVPSTALVETHENPSIEADDDEFSNFQKASPKFDDDLSVLVIDGKNIPSAQTLWVAENSDTSKQANNDKSLRPENSRKSSDKQNLLEIRSQYSALDVHRVSHKIEPRENKYDVFQEIDDDRFSVFHNPLPDDEDKHISSENEIKNTPLGTKSVFSHSLFSDSDSFKTDLQLVNNDFSKTNLQSNKPSDTSDHIDIDGNDDEDEFSTFQNFPVSFPDPCSHSYVENVDKYDIFRTIVFSGSDFNSSPNLVAISEEAKLENSPQVSLFEEVPFKTPDNPLRNHESELIGNFSEQPIEDIKFVNFQESSAEYLKNDSSNISNLFSSLAISAKTCDTDTIKISASDVDIIEDRYKALRLLEDNPTEVDDFGEFLVADVPNYENQPPKFLEKPSIQVRSLEACLNLLKDGFSTLSRVSSQEVVSEVLSDPRASTYLDCLLEVHRIGERIISNMESDACIKLKAELRQVWDHLGPYFTHTEHNHLTETVGAQCGVCHSNTGPSPVTFGAMTFHSPCANLYLHCVEPVLPNISSTPLVS